MKTFVMLAALAATTLGAQTALAKHTMRHGSAMSGSAATKALNQQQLASLNGAAPMAPAMAPEAPMAPAAPMAPEAPMAPADPMPATPPTPPQQ